MPRLPIDYSKTIIYKICCNDMNVTDIYVGHTTDIIRRRNHHKSHIYNEKSKEYNQYKYKFIRENGGWDNWSLVPVEEFSCENVNQACIRERYWIETLQASLNKVIPSRSKEEYREINKEKLNENKKEWYENNKDKILQKTKEYRENNKDKKKEKDKKYYERNKDKINEYKKQWYESNKEKNAEKSKQRYECNKDKLLEKFTCECGGNYVFSTKLRHFRSKKHQEYLTTINEDRQVSTEQTIT